LLANCSLLLGPYFAQNFASKFGQGLVGALGGVRALGMGALGGWEHWGGVGALGRAGALEGRVGAFGQVGALGGWEH